MNTSKEEKENEEAKTAINDVNPTTTNETLNDEVPPLEDLKASLLEEAFEEKEEDEEESDGEENYKCDQCDFETKY